MLAKLIEKKWKTSKQTDLILLQYKMFVSEFKQFLYDRFVSFRFAQNRLGSSPFMDLNMKNEYKDLWITMKFLLTLSHGQAAMERDFQQTK